MIRRLGTLNSECFAIGQVIWLVAALSSCSDQTTPNEAETPAGKSGGMGGGDSDSEMTGGKDAGSTSTGGKGSSGDVTGSGGRGMNAGGTASGGTSETGPTGGSDDGALGGQGGAMQGVPQLTSLEVQGGAVGLRPAFSPEVHRYALRAADPAQELEVTVEADPDVEISIADYPVKDGEPVALREIVPGTEIEILLESPSGGQQSYVLVYLPNDFPDLAITTLEEDASPDPIYIGLQFSGLSYAAKVDNNGVPLLYIKPERDAIDFKRHPDGRMSYADVVTNGVRVVLNEDLEAVDRIQTVGHTRTDGHEFKILPNGNYIVLAVSRGTWDLSEFGGPPDQDVLNYFFQEMTPDREVVFEWNTQDHIHYYESLALDRQQQDYAHPNSLDIDQDGNWLISSRFVSHVAKVDRETGDVIWKLGGLDSDFEFIDDPYDGFCGQHTASWVAENRILLFDNGTLFCVPGTEDHISRAVEYEINEQDMTATLVWSFTGIPARAMGSAQRLANGNTFLGWGDSKKVLATEVDPLGNVVFEMSSDTPEVYSYRAMRFPD